MMLVVAALLACALAPGLAPLQPAPARLAKLGAFTVCMCADDGAESAVDAAAEAEATPIPGQSGEMTPMDYLRFAGSILVYAPLFYAVAYALQQLTPSRGA